MPVMLIPESPTVEISAVVQTGKGTSTEADEEKKIGPQNRKLIPSLFPIRAGC